MDFTLSRRIGILFFALSALSELHSILQSSAYRIVKTISTTIKKKLTAGVVNSCDLIEKTTKKLSPAKYQIPQEQTQRLDFYTFNASFIQKILETMREL